jgi:hypothetical protein
MHKLISVSQAQKLSTNAALTGGHRTMRATKLAATFFCGWSLGALVAAGLSVAADQWSSDKPWVGWASMSYSMSFILVAGVLATAAHVLYAEGKLRIRRSTIHPSGKMSIAVGLLSFGLSWSAIFLLLLELVPLASPWAIVLTLVLAVLLATELASRFRGRQCPTSS